MSVDVNSQPVGETAQTAKLETGRNTNHGEVSRAAVTPVHVVAPVQVEAALVEAPVAESSAIDGAALRHIISSIDDFALIGLDVAGQITDWNDGARRMFGYEGREILGRSHALLYSDSERAAGRPEQDLQAVLSNGGRFEREAIQRRSDGAEFYGLTHYSRIFDAGARDCAFAMTVRDVTVAQRRSEVLQIMVEQSLNAVVLVDARGTILSVNAQTERIFGYTRGLLIGRSIDILVPDRFKPDHPKNRESFFANPVVRPMGAGRDLYGRRSDGSEFPVEIGLCPIETHDGPAVVGSIVDITERKRAETLARKHLVDLAHVARLSTVGQMFSELAHEINQPLGAAANFARACVIFARSGEGASREQMIEWMEKTAEQTTRAIDIVLRLGTFVKKDAGVRTEVDINRLIEKVLSLSEHALRAASESGEPVRLELKLTPNMPVTSADVVQIEQVLLNLIRNAIEAMQESAVGACKLTVATWFDDGFVHAAVEDTGPGIKSEDLSRLFDPYFTTKATGMGLGLSISRSIVEDHGGILDAKSSSQGTSFHFCLPIVKTGTHHD